LKSLKKDNKNTDFEPLVRFKLGGVGGVMPPTPIETRIDYDVVCGVNLDDLRIRVKKYLKEGWRLAGGATYSPKMGLWYQTVVLNN
jgi:hypothetical protein